MSWYREFGIGVLHAARNLLPIVVVVAIFQALVLRQVPDGLLAMIVGLAIVVLGVALFLQGLELAIFPLGKTLSNEFAAKGSVPWLTVFGFFIGFSAVIAEPALIAVAEQAGAISGGRIDALTLRFLVASSVGAVIALGVFRIIFALPLHWIMIAGYAVVVLVTFFAPPEIVGLAYDSGGVTTNIVTVPLIAALGLGLAASIRGRNPLTDGFGLVALAVMVPMITVQIYGIFAFHGADGGVPEPGFTPDSAVGASESPSQRTLASTLGEFFAMVRDVLPIILTILVFQFLVLRRRLPRPFVVAFGFALVVAGLYAFVVGLKMGLFPIGEAMAEQLIAKGEFGWIYLFAFCIGFATTMAEPALLAIGKQAESAAGGRIRGSVIRLVVALGVAIGITVGVHRIISGDSIHVYIIGGYVLVMILTLVSPRYITALAFDLGGITTSEVTVPLVTALGIGLAMNLEGRNVLIDGFGLIAFASIFPIISVMIYAMVMDLNRRKHGDSP
jgi:hypothetical protein